MPVSMNDELRLAYLRAMINAQTEDELLIARNREFYEGEQGIALTDRQKEYLGDIANDLDDQAFANVVKRCVGIPLERLGIDDISATTGNEAYGTLVKSWWKANRLQSQQNDLYRFALRDKASVLVVGWDAINKMPTFTVNELWDGTSGNVRLHYDPDTGELMYATKRWMTYNPLVTGQTGKMRLTAYWPDSVYRYEASAPGSTEWRLLEPSEIDDMPNPQPWTLNGRIDGEPIGLPIVPFWNPGGSEIDDILMAQKAINKSLADLLTGTDMHGFPIIWGAGVVLGVDPVTGATTLPKFGPGQAFFVEDANAKFGRIEPADLQKVFEYGVMSWVRIASFVKGWPMFLFDRSAQPPSGEALRHMEASLVSQITEKQTVFGDAWQDAFTVGARAAQAFGGTSATGEVELMWREATPADDKLTAESNEIRWRSGEIPRLQRWREMGYTDDEIKTMLAEERNDQANLAAQAAADAMRRLKTFTNDEPVTQFTSGENAD